jgi:DNA-binding transcriptional ArsR family regulator
MNKASDIFRSKWAFQQAPSYELFLALNHATDGEARAHGSWQASMRTLLARAPGAEALSRAGILWGLVPDVLEERALTTPLSELGALLQKIPPKEWQAKLLEGLIHREDLVDALIKGDLTLKEAVLRSKREKLEWLAYAGIYPYTPQSPLVQNLEVLCKSPAKFRDLIVNFVAFFHENYFEEYWERNKQRYSEILEEKRRLFCSTTLAEFTSQTYLRVDFDDQKQELRAIRGGYTLKFQDTDQVTLIPSAFNDRRVWTAWCHGTTSVCFPFFAPSLSPEEAVKGTPGSHIEPMLVMRALGDPTRYAIAKLIAQEGRTAADLCRQLHLSRATMSHHVEKLRNAGVIEEVLEKKSIVLKLQVKQIECLSTAVLNDLGVGL